jgi:twitching motility protein PilT
MRTNHGIRNCIRERKLEQVVGLMEIGRREGSHTFDESIHGLLERGIITREQALHHCRDTRNFPDPATTQEKPKSFWS